MQRAVMHVAHERTIFRRQIGQRVCLKTRKKCVSQQCWKKFGLLEFRLSLFLVNHPFWLCDSWDLSEILMEQLYNNARKEYVLYFRINIWPHKSDGRADKYKRPHFSVCRFFLNFFSGQCRTILCLRYGDWPSKYQCTVYF